MATVAPFIFVDNDSSQSAGREILGWPKVSGWFTKDIDSWARHPRNRREVLTLTTRGFDELYEGETSKARELLVIEEEPSPTFTEFPPDPGNPLNPLVSIPKAMVGWSNLAFQGLDLMTRLRLRGFSPDVDRGALARISQFMKPQENDSNGIQGNTINLKQMRDASNPDIACYQAITNAKMEVTRFHRGGMLGDLALLRGDMSGGYRIRLNEFESQPIISVLGLEVEEEDTIGDEVTTSFLRPVMPFWQEMDMRYLEATNVCWRTSKLEWRKPPVHRRRADGTSVFGLSPVRGIAVVKVSKIGWLQAKPGWWNPPPAAGRHESEDRAHAQDVSDCVLGGTADVRPGGRWNARSGPRPVRNRRVQQDDGDPRVGVRRPVRQLGGNQWQPSDRWRATRRRCRRFFRVGLYLRV